MSEVGIRSWVWSYNNTITDAMQVLLYGFFSIAIYLRFIAGDAHTDIFMVIVFGLICAIALNGALSHLPSVEKNKVRHDVSWLIMTILFQAANVFTLLAIHAHWVVVWSGSIVSLICLGIFVKGLFSTEGKFMWIALAQVCVYLLCILSTSGYLRFAWMCVLGSHVLWFILAQNRQLKDYKIHNDIYHFALMGSVAFLFWTAGKGLW